MSDSRETRATPLGAAEGLATAGPLTATAPAPISLHAAGDRVAMLRQFLAGRDEACPVCEYNLRDLQMPRCPECGLELELRLALSEPKQGAFVAGLIVIAGGLGFNFILLVYFGVFSMIRNFFPNLWEFWPVVPGTLVGVTMLGLWIRGRGRLRRMSTLTRWSLVLGAALMTLVWVGCFFATVW